MKTYLTKMISADDVAPRILSASLAVLVSAVLVGCGKKKEAPEAEPVPAVEQAAPEMQPKAPEEIRSAVPAPETEAQQETVTASTPDEAPETIEVITNPDECPFVLTDVRQVKLNEWATEGPNPGETIYSFSTIPEGLPEGGGCGMFWVMGSDGTVGMVSVCGGGHEH